MSPKKSAFNRRVMSPICRKVGLLQYERLSAAAEAALRAVDEGLAGGQPDLSSPRYGGTQMRLSDPPPEIRPLPIYWLAVGNCKGRRYALGRVLFILRVLVSWHCFSGPCCHVWLQLCHLFPSRAEPIPRNPGGGGLTPSNPYDGTWVGIPTTLLPNFAGVPKFSF